jgi:signal transduction histidine kinase
MNFFKKLFMRDMSQDELISVITHQFRTPLSNIKWTLDAFLKGEQGALTAEQEKMLTRAYDSTERLVTFVDDILEAHKVEKGTLPTTAKNINLLVIVENVVSDLSPKAEADGKKLTITSIPRQEATIYADPMQVRMIIQCLVENAIQYSESNTDIAITLKKDDRHITVQVRDDGIGIPVESQDHIYERLYRAKNAISKDPNGSGLGLYVASMLTIKNNGELTFTSSEEAGTTFILTFQIADTIEQ